MKSEIISDALNMLNDDIIEETATVRASKKKCEKDSQKLWWKWAFAAACLTFAAYAGTRTLHSIKFPNIPILPIAENIKKTTLPMLSVTENTNEAMGFEGYLVYDISELVNENPWNETMELSTLPVYKNPLSYNENMIASGADFDKMHTFLIEIAGRLGLDPNTLIITDNAFDEKTRQQITEKMDGNVPNGYFNPTALMIETVDLTIEVDQTMTAKITFEPAISLPEEYHFTHYASYENIVAVAGYLKNEYKSFIGIDNPCVDISGGDYNIYLQQGYQISFFDSSGTDIEQLVNYNFNRVSFYCDDEGKLFLARIYQPDLSKKVGDYPIITVATARKLLADGKYITTVPYEMPGMEYVAKTELIYRAGTLEEYYMPYYRFYVELPNELRDGALKNYGTYYVPAVESTYISNMPIWNGSF